jgi:hypothetical protein
MKSEKEFDCVAMKAEIQERLLREVRHADYSLLHTLPFFPKCTMCV